MATRLRDYYEVLGVPRTASQNEIRDAFRRLARQYHPDVRPDDPQATERFKEISEAYEVLGDPEKRSRYEELGAMGQQAEGRQAPDGGPFADGTRVRYRTASQEDLEDLFGSSSPFSDFFYDLFGGAEQRQGAGGAPPSQPGEDIEAGATISLEEAYRGTSRTVEVAGPGSSKRIAVQIPPGVRDGTLVRAAGQGGSGLGGGAAGDLYLRVHVLPHPAFRREGDDLYLRVQVPLDVALLGGEAQVPALKGARVTVRIAPGTQNGTRLRLRGLGMPRQREEGHGDLFAEVDVRLPTPVPDELRQAVERMRSLQEAAGDGP